MSISTIPFLQLIKLPPEMPESSAQQHENEQSYEIFQIATAELRRKLKTQERHKKSHHQLFSAVFNFLAIVQLVIGATITALGPLANEHMLAITVLGALNTVVAGILALMKGRGLPQRLRNDVAEIRKVLTFIDNTGIRLRSSNNKYSNAEIMRLIEEALNRYVIMCEIIEKNQPDSYAGRNMSGDQMNSEPFGGMHRTDEEMGHGT